MSESTARQLFELAFAFVTGAALGAMRFPVYILRQVFYRLAALWDVIFYALAGLAVFAAGQWCSGKNSGAEKKMSGKKREKKMKKFEKISMQNRIYRLQ